MQRSNSSQYGYRGGFTLIEVLFALMLFGIIAATVFASFSAISKGVEKGRESADFYHLGRGALLRLTQELAAAYRFHHTSCQEDSPSFICEPLKGEDGTVDGMPQDRLMFLTLPYRLTPQRIPASGICDVCYYIGQNAQGVPALFRHENCVLDDKDKEADRCRGKQEALELADMVVGLDVTYTAAKKPEVHAVWPPEDTRKPDGTLPCRVHVELILRRASQDERFATTVGLPLGGICEEER